MVILILSAYSDPTRKLENHDLHNCFNKYTIYRKKQNKDTAHLKLNLQSTTNFHYGNNLTIKKRFLHGILQAIQIKTVCFKNTVQLK